MTDNEIDDIFVSGAYANFTMDKVRALDAHLIADRDTAQKNLTAAKGQRHVALIQRDNLALAESAAGIAAAETEIERATRRRSELDAAFGVERSTTPSYQPTGRHYRQP